MQPTGGNRDVTPDFGYARRSVEMGEGNAAASPNNFKLPDIAHVTEGMPKVSKFGESRGMDLEPEAEMPMPTATPPSTRPAPQPTSVAAIDKTMPMATMEPNPRRGMELDWSRNPKVTPSLTVADRLGQLGTSVGDINEAYRRSGYYDYDTDTLKPVSDMSPKANEFESAIEQAKSQKQAISNLGKKRR
jgi:hypothetical protein